MKPFEYWNNLTKNKVLPEFEEDLNDYSQFQMNKYTSFVNLYLAHACLLNKYDIPKAAHYKYLFSVLPKNDIKVNYMEAKKKNNEDEKWVARYFEFGSRDVQEAMKLLKPEDIINIKKKFGIIK